MTRVRVLVVDDEVDFVETLVIRLNRRQIETAGVTSGEDALALMRKRHFDLVLLDVKMPGGIDGIETLREIKRLQPHTEVILLTGHASLETSLEGMRLGAFDYLLKPVRLEELLKKMGRALQHKRLQEQRIGNAEGREND